MHVPMAYFCVQNAGYEPSPSTKKKSGHGNPKTRSVKG